ncbi:MAG: M20 family metallopeptidase [Microthrixaceae bacterium]|nr:M20 family metallopeptidase [Microthrixaceae bacterium]
MATTVSAQEAKELAFSTIDAQSETLIGVSQSIFANPELGFEEHFAHDLLASTLDRNGFDVTRSAFGLQTAFCATVGTDGPEIGVICEYDALPGLGHACGHNVIAAAGLGAAIGLAPLATKLGGRLRVLGTPAEEGGGGKEFMIRAGAFDGLTAAMMVHPADHNLPTMKTLAFQGLVANYTGRAAHAAASPHLGANALDAAVLGYNAVAALRQHIRPAERIHGIFTKAGDKPNIVPAEAEAVWYIRAATTAHLEELKPRVLSCLEAGATAAGCELEITWLDPPYGEMVDNSSLLALYASNADLVARTFDSEAPEVVGSTDMGNVSQVVPSIHPMIAVAPPGVSIHTEEFAVHAGGESGDRAVIDGAKAMAATVIDCWADPGAITDVGSSRP